MKLSQLVGQRLKEAPRDAQTASHVFLIRGGYARVVAYGEDTRYESELRALEKLARGDRLGMWTYS